MSCRYAALRIKNMGCGGIDLDANIRTNIQVRTAGLPSYELGPLFCAHIDQRFCAEGFDQFHLCLELATANGYE